MVVVMVVVLHLLMAVVLHLLVLLLLFLVLSLMQPQPQLQRQGGGGGAGAPVAPVRNAQYIYRSPLVIVEVEGKKVSWDHNKYASKAFCAMACGLAFAPQGYIVHVFPDKVDVISTCWDVNDMTIKCEAECINMQRDDQNLATQFDTLTRAISGNFGKAVHDNSDYSKFVFC